MQDEEGVVDRRFGWQIRAQGGRQVPSRLQESKKAKVAFRLAPGPHRLSPSGAPPLARPDPAIVGFSSLASPRPDLLVIIIILMPFANKLGLAILDLDLDTHALLPRATAHCDNPAVYHEGSHSFVILNRYQHCIYI